MVRIFPVFILLCVSFSARLAAQETANKLTLEGAIQLALKNYPAIRSARAQADAAAAGADLARTSYLPRADLLWQENRATRNNVFGTLLPQAILPSMSGPVLGTTDSASAWGSAGGMLISWEPFDFGARKANVDLARALQNKADAGIEVTQLEVEFAAADAWLALTAAEKAVVAAQANVDRTAIFARAVHALADNQLRPGADASRADAELAVARNQLIQAQAAVSIGRADLAGALGIAGSDVNVDPDALPEPPGSANPLPVNLAAHPLARAQAAAVQAAQARERNLDRSYFPRFNYQFALYGRGSGALLDGRIDSTQGLAPDVQNWATGLTVTFSVLDIFSIRARKRAEFSNENAEQARYDQVMQDLRTQDAKASAELQAAISIASNTPVQLAAAQDAHTKARARYEAGLATVVEVADAQRLLAEAQLDNAVARVDVWRGILSTAKSHGNIDPFLQQLRSAANR